MHTYTLACMHVCIYIHTDRQTERHIYIHKSTCTHTSTHIQIKKYLHTWYSCREVHILDSFASVECTVIYIHTYTHTHLHTHALPRPDTRCWHQSHVQSYIHIYIHIYIHTHKQAREGPNTHGWYPSNVQSRHEIVDIFYTNIETCTHTYVRTYIHINTCRACEHALTQQI